MCAFLFSAFYPSLIKGCIKSVMSCADEAMKVVKETFWFKQGFFEVEHVNLTKVVTNELYNQYTTPFGSSVDQYNFVATLSYFFCL